MLGAFSFLGKEKAKEIVVQNTQQLADSIEDISPIQDGLFTPNIEGAEQDMRDLCYDMAKKYMASRYRKLLPNGWRQN